MSRIRRARLAVAGTAAAVVSGCGMPVFRPASGPADRVAHLGIFMLVTAGVIFVAVLVILGLATGRHREREPDAVDLTPRGHGWIIYGGGLMPTIVLSAVFVASLWALGRFPARATRALTVHVVAHQWWWEVRYTTDSVSDEITTADEIHIPVGQPVRMLLTSRDVIHSFWVPELQGKLDLIPGDTNDLRLAAEKPGTYVGVCAEYCGLQHAHMAFRVVADAPAEFARWLAAQRAPAAEPRDSLALEGRQLFVSGPCAMCHTVSGTGADGKVAPDLTHVGGRRTLAAGTLVNSLGNMEAWITNAQALKPGAKMPTMTQFTGRQLRAVATYLEGLR